MYIPALIMSAAAELKSCQNAEGGLVRLPCWGNVSETDDRYRTHQWAHKTDVTLIPVVAAPPPRNLLRIPPRRKPAEGTSSTPAKAGPSKRAATASPSPKGNGNKRMRAASRPTVPMAAPKRSAGPLRQVSKSKVVVLDAASEKVDEKEKLVKQKEKGKGKKAVLPDPVSEKVAEEQELVMQKDKGKTKAVEKPAKVSVSMFHRTNYH